VWQWGQSRFLLVVPAGRQLKLALPQAGLAPASVAAGISGPVPSSSVAERPGMSPTAAWARIDPSYWRSFKLAAFIGAGSRGTVVASEASYIG